MPVMRPAYRLDMDKPSRKPASDKQHLLLTPTEAGRELLEAAALKAYRSNGLVGLLPVVVGDRRAYRMADVRGFINTIFEAA